MIPGDQRYACVLAVFPKQFLDEQIVFIAPKPFPSKLPSVDKITDDIQVLTLDVAKELQQWSYASVTSAKMHV